MKIIYFRSDFVVPILHTTNKGINQIKLKKESFKTLKGLKMSFQSKQIPVHSTSLHYKWWYMYHIYIYDCLVEEYLMNKIEGKIKI